MKEIPGPSPRLNRMVRISGLVFSATPVLVIPLTMTGPKIVLIPLLIPGIVFMIALALWERLGSMSFLQKDSKWIHLAVAVGIPVQIAAGLPSVNLIKYVSHPLVLFAALLPGFIITVPGFVSAVNLLGYGIVPDRRRHLVPALWFWAVLYIGLVGDVLLGLWFVRNL